MPYETTPLEPRPQTSAYNHLPPYTFLAPEWQRPPTPVVKAAEVSVPPSRSTAWRWWVALGILFFVVLRNLGGASAPTVMPSIPPVALSTTFFVFIPDGWTQVTPTHRRTVTSSASGMASATEPETVVQLRSSVETFTVYVAAATTSSCAADLSGRASKIPGTPTPVAVPDIDGSPAQGIQVRTPSATYMLACTERNGSRYVLEDAATASSPSFTTIVADWHWR